MPFPQRARLASPDGLVFQSLQGDGSSASEPWWSHPDPIRDPQQSWHDSKEHMHDRWAQGVESVGSRKPPWRWAVGRALPVHLRAGGAYGHSEQVAPTVLGWDPDGGAWATQGPP